MIPIKYISNFIARAVIFWVLSIIFLQHDIWQSLFGALFFATTFIAFDAWIGSASQAQQDKKFLQLLAGTAPTTTKRRVLRILAILLYTFGAFVLISSVTALIFGEHAWVFVVSAAASIIVMALMVIAAKRHICQQAN